MMVVLTHNGIEVSVDGPAVTKEMVSAICDVLEGKPKATTRTIDIELKINGTSAEDALSRISKKLNDIKESGLVGNCVARSGYMVTESTPFQIKSLLSNPPEFK